MRDPAAARVWSDPTVLATPLVLLLTDRYLPEPGSPQAADADAHPINWSPEVWVEEIRTDCGVALPDENLDRLAAAAVVLTTPDRFYRAVDGFEFVSRVLFSGVSGQRFDLRGLASPVECAWGVAEAAFLSEGEPYGDAVTAYVRAALRDWGVRDPGGLFAHVGKMSGVDPGPPPFSDDPEVEGADAAGSRAAEAEVVGEVRDGLRKLAAQVQALPLRRGSAASLAARIGAAADSLG